MSQRIYVFLKPSKELTFSDMANKINDLFPGMAEINSEGDIDLHAQWPGYITTPSNCYEDSTFPYKCIFFWCYWDSILKSTEFRKYLNKLCNIFGATEWWYIEEESIDFVDDLNTEEFEKILKESFGIEKFEMPHYFPESKHYFFKDSSDRVNSLID